MGRDSIGTIRTSNNTFASHFGMGRTEHIKHTMQKFCPLSQRLRRANVFDDEFHAPKPEPAVEPEPERKRRHKPHRNDENWSILDIISGSPKGDALIRTPRETSETPTNLQNSVNRRNRDEDSDSESENRRCKSSGLERRRVTRRSAFNEDGTWAFARLQTPLPPHGIDSSDSDSDDELLFGRKQSVVSSSGSSLSWAEDAFENGQTDEMKVLWRDIEDACEGNGKAVGMSDAVYEECLQWRRAFPTQCSAPSRFKFMMELQNEGEDSTPTPTNEESIREQFSVLDASLSESRAEDCATPNPETSTEFVSSWLSQCQIISEEDLGPRRFSVIQDGERMTSADSIESRFLGQNPSRLTSSSNAIVFARDDDPGSPIFPRLASKSAYPTRVRLLPSAQTYAELSDTRIESIRGRNMGNLRQQQHPRPDRLGSTKAKSRGLSSASWSRYANEPNTSNTSNIRLPTEQEDPEDNSDNGAYIREESQRNLGTPRPVQRPSYLPLHVQRGGASYKYNSRNNAIAHPKPVKPFMLWLFNNVSPN